MKIQLTSCILITLALLSPPVAEANKDETLVSRNSRRNLRFRTEVESVKDEIRRTTASEDNRMDYLRGGTGRKLKRRKTRVHTVSKESRLRRCKYKY